MSAVRGRLAATQRDGERMGGFRRWQHRLTPRPLRTRIGARVLAGFGLTAAIAALVACVSLIYNAGAGRSLASVTERDREVSALFRELEVAVEQQSGAIQNLLLSGDERDLEALRAGRSRFLAALDMLEQRLPTSEQGTTLTDIRQQAVRLEEIAEEELDLNRQSWIDSANYLWRTDGLATKQSLLDAIHRQVAIHNEAVDREIESSTDYLYRVEAAAFSLVAVAAILAFAIGLGITRAVTRPVSHLMQVARAVQRDDYSVRAPVTGEDELAALSGTMNAMVEGLAASRAQLEHALSEAERSEERYRLLAENANDIIYTLDHDRRITFINPAVRRVLGFEPEELIGAEVTETLVPHLAELGGPSMTHSAEEPGTLTGDLQIRSKDGRMVALEVNSTLLIRDGHIVGLQGIARDMTERHRMEQELLRLNAQERRRADQLITVNQLGRKIAALQQVDTLLPSLVHTLGRTFGYRHVRIVLENESGVLRTAGAWQQPNVSGHGASEEDEGTEDMPVSPLVLRALEGDAGFVAGSGRPEDDAAIRYTEVAVPIRTKTRVLGVLDIRGDAGSGLDESDIFTLQTLADQIAVAIENARLYETGQQLAVSEERNRLARDLHDSVTQELFSMTMMASALPALIERRPDVARERAERLQNLARGALAEMRALLFALRPASLADEGLIAAVTKHAAAFESREGVTVHVEIDGEGRPPHTVEEAFYRVMQEARNNISKHAKAENVWITLVVDDDCTSLQIRDDGEGFDSAAPGDGAGMGMRTMRERIAEINGDFVLNSTPGLGVTVQVSAPLGTAQAGVA